MGIYWSYSWHSKYLLGLACMVKVTKVYEVYLKERLAAEQLRAERRRYENRHRSRDKKADRDPGQETLTSE